MGTSVTSGVLVNNQGASPLGNGWSLEELSSLTVQDDGVVVVSEGDGTTLAFRPDLLADRLDAPVAFPADFPLQGTADDLNGDGLMDYAVAEAGTGMVKVLFGDGAGGFTPLVPDIQVGQPGTLDAAGFLITPDTFDVRSGDFNGDGIKDLVSANQTSFKYTLHLGAGDGSFTSVDVAAPRRPIAMAVADFNGDGLDDLAAGMRTGFATRNQVFFGSAAGTLVPGPVLSTTIIANNVLAADFTGDGAPDVMLVSPRSAGVWLYAGDGAGNFGTGVFTLVSSAMIGLLNRVSAAGGINRRRRSNLRRIV